MLAQILEQTQLLLLMLERTISPLQALAAALLLVSRKPTVEVDEPALEKSELKYPVAEKPPLSPIRISSSSEELMLTPFSKTVMRLTQDGMAVKSISVPEVEVWAFADVSG